jgi:hypothetical protein
MSNYNWLKSKNKRIYKEIKNDLYENYLIDVGYMDENEYISGYEKNIVNIKNKNIFILTFIERIDSFVGIELDSYYPFKIPKKIIVNDYQYQDLLNIDSNKLKLVGIDSCLCCSSITCSNNWGPTLRIKSILEEIENNMLIKRNIVNKIIINVIKRKYLINDINLYQYIEEL